VTFGIARRSRRAWSGARAKRSSTQALFCATTDPWGPTMRARISVVYPPPANTSTTSMPGSIPKNANVSTG